MQMDTISRDPSVGVLETTERGGTDERFIESEGCLHRAYGTLPSPVKSGKDSFLFLDDLIETRCVGYAGMAPGTDVWCFCIVAGAQASTMSLESEVELSRVALRQQSRSCTHHGREREVCH